MRLYYEFNKNFSDDAFLDELQGEMSKYKTLAHETIKWDRVFDCSYKILQSFSLDTKFFSYLCIAATNINLPKNYEILKDVLKSFLEALKDDPQRLGQTEKLLATKRKIFINSLDGFIEELNKQNLNCPQNFVDSMVSLLNELGKNINHKFASIDVSAYTSKQSEYESERPTQTQVANQVQSNAHTAASLNFSAHTDIKSINDREYRDFFINLSLELLKDDLRNVNAYAIFMQALWGRIKALPASNDFITPVRYPEQNLIINIKNIESLNLENLRLFMQNLALNPFWIDGLMIFCKFLEKNNLSFIENFISEQVAVFLNIHIDIRKLKFQSSEDMCPKETFDFFMNQKGAKQENTSDKNIDDLDINEILMDINAKNTTNNSRENLNSMLLMASAFSGKGMKSNAKAIYAQIVNFIENTELKEYLSDIYKKAKSF